MIFQLSEESRERISKVLDLGRVALHYGWIPFVIYVGWAQTLPRPGLVKLLSPFPTA
ncbi:YALIA101S09e01090g1_1 [Yarrowia lipolytica]|nr:Tom7 [Yarrowia lipolytica]SEI35896.1 YALIA101S09e01090g1_1 [Yarrowia lipolytica]VBB89408.1 Component of the TOM (translocase of outer membrane) complex, putative [Yarrowia lipolytica]